MKARCKWVEGLSAIAAIITALASAWTLGVNIVERNEVDTLQKRAEKQETALNNAMDQVKIYGDMLAAGGGNRFAYKCATEALQTHALAGDKDAESLNQQLGFMTHHFMGEIEHNTTLQNYIMGPLSESLKANIIDMLRQDDARQRICALKHIHGFRLNKYIPLVVDCLEKEPDLNVVQLAVHIVNETFRDNMIFNDTNTVYSLSVDDCALRYNDFKKYFNLMWKPRKERILARKPKEARERPDPPRGTLYYIFDPEQPNEN